MAAAKYALIMQMELVLMYDAVHSARRHGLNQALISSHFYTQYIYIHVHRHTYTYV